MFCNQNEGNRIKTCQNLGTWRKMANRTEFHLGVTSRPKYIQGFLTVAEVKMLYILVYYPKTQDYKI